MAISLEVFVFAFLAFVASLFLPLFLVPELLQRRGLPEWKARLVGWLIFAGVMLAAIALFSGGRAFAWGSLMLWETWGVIGALLFAVGWDVRRARSSAREPGAETK